MSRLPGRPASGEHYWAVSVLFHIADPLAIAAEGSPAILDGENLVFVGPPCCYFCEESYRPETACRPCAGPPKVGD
jgi:hypothetical protein